MNAYVIEHANGLILFDTGQDRASVTDERYFPGGFTGYLYDRHQDHIGGLAELAGSDLLVSAAEWAELAKPGPELRGFLRSHIQLPGLHWRQVSPEPTRGPALAPFTESLDVMADGSLVLLPTPGHTAGSMSLLVRRTGRPPLLLAGDLTNGAGILLRGQLPGVGSRRQLAQSTRKVLALAQRQPGLVVLPATTPQPPSGCFLSHLLPPMPTSGFAAPSRQGSLIPDVTAQITRRSREPAAARRPTSRPGRFTTPGRAPGTCQAVPAIRTRATMARPVRRSGQPTGPRARFRDGNMRDGEAFGFAVRASDVDAAGSIGSPVAAQNAITPRAAERPTHRSAWAGRSPTDSPSWRRPARYCTCNQNDHSVAEGAWG